MGGGDDPGAGMATTGAASANKTNKSVRLAVEEATAGGECAFELTWCSCSLRSSHSMPASSSTPVAV